MYYFSDVTWASVSLTIGILAAALVVLQVFRAWNSRDLHKVSAKSICDRYREQERQDGVF